MRSPIFVALDVDDEQTALKIVEATEDLVGGFKIGPRLAYRYGQEFSRRLARQAALFVDCKFHDIPSTVEAALTAVFESGASFATVHASNGRVCLQQLAKLESEFQKERFFKILSVTVLTSFEESSLPKNWQAQKTIGEHVSSLAREVLESGLNGLVCAPTEVQSLRNEFSNAYIVTPGIRASQDKQTKSDDQKRTMSASEALGFGADALVIGRPIVAAKDPREAVLQILNSIKGAKT
jgi:orotidine-5'-phosphate decarboxylase